MKSLTELVAERVACGAQLLDDREPDWFNRVAIGNLNMHDCFLCVLGQTFGLYAVGVDKLGLDVNSTVVDYGFNGIGAHISLGSLTEGERLAHTADIKALEAEWARVIQERRAG